MTYILYTNGVLEKDGFYIPLNEANSDYIEYLTWIAQGNTPESVDGRVYLAKKEQEILDREQARAEYQNMIDRLNQIQNISNPTNAQVIQAMKDEAQILERVLKALKRIS